MFLKLVLSFFKILVLKFMLTSADVFTDTATGILAKWRYQPPSKLEFAVKVKILFV